MGFKRTPEGRVFFQGADTANDETPKLGTRSSNPSPQMRSPLTGEKTQGQIITLLKTLNERLKVTQADRDRMMVELDKHRTIIEDLEDKANRSERIALDLEHKLEAETKNTKTGKSQIAIKELEETRRAMAEMQKTQTLYNKALADKITKSGSGIKALHRRIESTEAKQNIIDERIEVALAEQAKIVRKVDKAIEDRARFMRKIERIEETVIQTRDAINAKAMVVLTDQGVSNTGAASEIPKDDLTGPISQGLAKYLPDDLEAQIEEAARNAQRVEDIQTPLKDRKADHVRDDNQSAFKNPSFYAALTGGLVFILAVVVISGLAINDWKLPSLTTTTTEADDFQTESYYQTPQIPNVSDNVAEVKPIENLNWSIEQTNQAPITSIEPSNDDVGAVNINDTEQIAELIETQPQIVAKVLNEIEPQKQTPATANVQEQPAPSAQEPKELAVQIASKPQAEQTISATQPNPSQAQSLASQIERDPNLPSAIKKVENQAFEGIGEAQHDLAAIYTAGHGGVTQDYSRASFWFEKAAENGIANASYNLGVLNHQGLGTKPDIQQAMSWYQDAAAKGHPEAQYNLGIAYIEGIGVSYEPNLAANYFENAANNGIVEAAYNLGLIYENGLLGAAKPDAALRWYKTAADQGSPEAKQALNDLATNLGINAEEVNRIADSVTTDQSIQDALQTQSAPVASPDKETMNISSQGLIAQVQEYLMRNGLYPGPADGVSGALTSDAIRSYQSRNNLNTDGEATQSLLTHMLSNAN
ncbi:MAG: peptidoglycan-binding protein [Bdellovibrionales bacterium]